MTAKWHGGLAGIYNTYTQGRGTRHIRQSGFVFEGRLRIEKASWICVMFYTRFFQLSQSFHGTYWLVLAFLCLFSLASALCSLVGTTGDPPAVSN